MEKILDVSMVMMSLAPTWDGKLVYLIAAHAYTLPPDLLVKARALERARCVLYFASTAWVLLALTFLTMKRMGERIANLAARATNRRAGETLIRRPFLQGLVAIPLWLLILVALGLPAELIAHHLNLEYGLSVEGWAAWVGDWLRSTLLTMIMGTLILTTLYALLRQTRAAWFWFWVGTLPCAALAVLAAPLVIDPLFNHFTPLADRDPELVSQLQRVVARGGLSIPASRMFVMDASRRYTGMNAYVTGFGASKRVVVWDTTLPGGPDGKTPGGGVPIPELLDIDGHEQGHYVLGHIWKGMLYTDVLLFVFYWLAFRLLRFTVRRWGDRWHIADNPADWSSLGMVLLIATLLGFIAEPPGNGFSRMQEHQADVYGQEVIHGLVADPQSVAVADFNRLGRVWLEEPEPNRFFVWWSYSHPPTGDRADFAATYDPWGPGRHPRYLAH